MENKTFLVTGGCGYIGNKIVDELIERNYNVYVVDDLSTSNIDEFDPLKPEYMNDKAKYFLNEDCFSFVQNLEIKILDFNKIYGVVHLCKRHNLERCKYLFSKTYIGYVNSAILLLNKLMDYRNQFKRFVTLGNITQEVDKNNRLLPQDCIESCLSTILQYNHIPPVYGLYMLRVEDKVDNRIKNIVNMVDGTFKHSKNSDIMVF